MRANTPSIRAMTPVHPGMKPPMARLALARKIGAITLLVWKEVLFDAEHLNQQAA